MNNSINAMVAQANAESAARARAATRITNPIDAPREFAVIETESAKLLNTVATQMREASLAAKLQLENLARALCSQKAALYEEYQGGAPLVSEVDPNKTGATQHMVIDHVAKLGNELKRMVSAAKAEIQRGWIALGTGITLLLVSALALLYPALHTSTGEGSFDALPKMLVISLIALCLGLTSAGASLKFHQRLFQKNNFAVWFVACVAVVLIARYVATFIQSDPDAIDTMPRWARQAVYWIAASGSGFAVFVSEWSAGAMIGYWWRVGDRRVHVPYAESVLSNISDYHTLRAKTAAQVADTVPDAHDLTELGCQYVAQVIDDELQQWREIMSNAAIVTAPGSATGATYERYDIAALISRTEKCEQARDQLLCLAQGSKPPAPTTTNSAAPAANHSTP